MNLKNKPNRVLVLGCFAYHSNRLDGQIVKTRQTYKLIQDNYKGMSEMFCTQNLRNNPILIFILFWKLLRCNTIVTLFASSGGFQTIVPIIYKFCNTFRKRMIYIAIGSGQIDCIEGTGIYSKKRDDLKNICGKIHGFLAETSKVKDILENRYKYKNVSIFPNFRYFDNNIPYIPHTGKCLKLVFMARIMPEKGYHVVFNFFEYIQNKGYDISLDFYGPINDDCYEDFSTLCIKYNRHNINYKGILQPDEIYTTLVNYDIMLLPTKREGIPGSIIDGYICSLPSIVTAWEFAHEIVINGRTGFIVPYDDPQRQEEFNHKIIELYENRTLLEELKKNAFNTRNKYSSTTAWIILEKYL